MENRNIDSLLSKLPEDSVSQQLVSILQNHSKEEWQGLADDFVNNLVEEKINEIKGCEDD